MFRQLRAVQSDLLVQNPQIDGLLHSSLALSWSGHILLKAATSAGLFILGNNEDLWKNRLRGQQK